MYQLNTATISKYMRTNLNCFFPYSFLNPTEKISHRKTHHSSVFLTGWTQQIYREEKRRKCHPNLTGDGGMLLEQHRHSLMSHGWICSLQPRAFTWALPSSHKILSRQPQASMAASHHVPAAAVTGLNTLAQNIMKHTAGSHLNNSSSASAPCMARPLVLKPAGAKMLQIKGRAQLNIHFPRHLLLPIPFLFFSTPLTLRTHCCCFYFVCFEMLLPRSRLVPIGFSSCFPQVKCSFSQLHCLSCWPENPIQKGCCRDHTVPLKPTAFNPEWAESSSNPAETQWNQKV